MYAIVPMELPGLVSCSTPSPLDLRMNGGGADGFGGAGENWRQFRQTEIENFGGAAFDQKNIRGFNVAMDDSLGMGRVESVGDLDADLEQLGNIQGLPEMRCFRVWPSSNSMAMNGRPSNSPMS